MLDPDSVSQLVERLNDVGRNGGQLWVLMDTQDKSWSFGRGKEIFDKDPLVEGASADNGLLRINSEHSFFALELAHVIGFAQMGSTHPDYQRDNATGGTFL